MLAPGAWVHGIVNWEVNQPLRAYTQLYLLPHQHKHFTHLLKHRQTSIALFLSLFIGCAPYSGLANPKVESVANARIRGTQRPAGLTCTRRDFAVRARVCLNTPSGASAERRYLRLQGYAVYRGVCVWTPSTPHPTPPTPTNPPTLTSKVWRGTNSSGFCRLVAVGWSVEV